MKFGFSGDKHNPLVESSNNLTYSPSNVDFDLDKVTSRETKAQTLTLITKDGSDEKCQTTLTKDPPDFGSGRNRQKSKSRSRSRGSSKDRCIECRKK